MTNFLSSSNVEARGNTERTFMFFQDWFETATVGESLDTEP